MSKAEQFIKDYTRGCSNELCAVEDKYGKKVISYHEWLTPEQALSAVAYAREEMIDKAVKWLKDNTDRYLYNTGGYGEYIPKCGGKMFEDFKKTMEE